MKLHSRFLAGVFLFSSLLPSTSFADDFSSWLNWQREKTVEYFLPNLSPTDAHPGVVIAATSRSYPDYYYHWVRDAGIVVQAAIGEFERTNNSSDKKYLARFLLDFVDFSRKNQLSKTLSGYGEPKFHVNGDPYTGPWGRPQNDGPALRAIALVQLANVWMKDGKEDWVRSRLFDGRLPSNTVLKADLEFVASHWRDTCFDLWEEVKGVHFYSRMAMRRALLDGAWLADRLDDGGAADHYRRQAALIEEEIHRHWDDGKGVMVPTIDRDGGLDYKHEGLDASVIIGALHGRTSDGFYSVTSDRMLATFYRLVERFTEIYPINRSGGPGVAIGRYPEDRYNGGVTGADEGNPWFLLTAGFAEFLFRSASEFERQGSFSINHNSAAFFRWLGINSNDSVGRLAEALRRKADTFLARVKYHGGDDGRMPEQINRHSGYRQGAENLTWSYAAFLTALAAR